ncbi:MAG: cobaltochelatase subunit CobN [Pseudomonadota bacterium]
MHLLAAQPGMITDGSEAVDLGQSPGDVVILSAAESELACLAAAQHHLARQGGGDLPSLRLASLLQLGHNMSVDLYVEDVLTHAKYILVRLLGGRGYWEYGVEQLVALAREKDIPLLLLPGDDQPDAELLSLSTRRGQDWQQAWRYLVEGGPDNAQNLLRFVYEKLDPARDWRWQNPVPLVKAGLYWPGLTTASLPDLQAKWPDASQPVAAIVFYRALIQAGNLDVIDGMIAALRDCGLNALPVFVSSLKDPVAAALVAQWLAESGTDIILNTTGFAFSVPGDVRAHGPFDAVDAPVLQMVLSGGSQGAWESGVNGLSGRDIAMNVALPEVDGRILSRAVSFKGSAGRDDLTGIELVKYVPVADRLDFVAQLAANWVALRRTAAPDRRVAMIMANYPNKDARLGNGVGLDTPAGMIETLRAMIGAGYRIENLPDDGAALIAAIKAGPTNDITRLADRDIRVTLPLADYQAAFAVLPASVRDQVIAAWGAPQDDPFFLKDAGPDNKGAFALSVVPMGHVVVGLQPARGYNIDPQASYHSPDLVPPHNYFAFYIWLRHHFGAQAIVHFGKHGNMEWLPGKSLALSQDCFPEAVFGPTPHLYPFIVNDPGEGTQAKRRAQAVIIDHLTPPLTRAESYGPLKDLEALVDEYYEAAAVDPRRVQILKRDILELTIRIGLDRDCGIVAGEDTESALAKLDNYLCELKELQIRDGLHIFGKAPDGELRDDLLVALARLPRGADHGPTASLHRAIARDLWNDPAFDPLDCVFAEFWTGAKPAMLCAYDAVAGSWRTTGDTVERIELLARDLVIGSKVADKDWTRTKEVLCDIETSLRPAVTACGAAEIAGILRGLDGKFVEPGPSGAPTRGRPDVLPTGRNFYSVDTRTVPTPAAWQLGWKSAELMLERHVQEQGEWPAALGLSVWGTSNMRTGGDDIAQAMALLGVRPTWDSASRRVTGFEIIPISLLARPRVDVTLRISGFFRDAFPGLIDLFDSAVRAVAALDEAPDMNPLAVRVAQEQASFIAGGMDETDAAHRAGFRVFGAKPGAYGAGLQAMIDEKLWENEDDLADAYLAWGGYAYGNGGAGEAARDLFETRLTRVDAIVHNQDNREHDLLDSDDYYQFEGGMTAAVRHLSGQQPVVYHNDHSRPESPKIRTLNEEIARVVRARVVNPKWINGVMRHGYKGAFEMAATVDYLFAFAATARCVADHHFDLVYDAYLGDQTVRDFIKTHNPDALADIRNRLAEAIERGLWQPRRNSVARDLGDLGADSQKSES